MPLLRTVGLGLFLVVFGITGSAAGQSATSESATWRVEGGSGYYTQEGSDAGGVGLFLNVGRRLHTGFVGSFGFGIAQTYHRYSSQTPIFGNDRYYRTHYIFRLGFDYPFELTDRQNVALGTGVLYVRRYYVKPGVRIQRGPNGERIRISGRADPVTPGAVGLSFTARYSYQFSRVSLGFRADAHLFQFEKGGEYIVAPFIAVQF